MSFYGHVSGSECYSLWNVIQPCVCSLIKELGWLAGALGFTAGLFPVPALEFPSLVSRVVLINVQSHAGYSCQQKSLSDSVTEIVRSLRISLLPSKGETGWAPMSCQPFQVSHSRPIPWEITKGVFVSFCSPLLWRFLIENVPFQNASNYNNNPPSKPTPTSYNMCRIVIKLCKM